jgi:preprotein translocase subunit SecA
VRSGDKRGSEGGLVNVLCILQHERGLSVKARELVKKAGGLYVIGTEKHESVRIDQQVDHARGLAIACFGMMVAK